LNEQDDRSERPDLMAAMVSAWPIVGRWQARLNNSQRVQFLLRLARSPSVQRVLRASIVIAFVTFVGLAVYRNWAELQQYDWHADVRYLALAVVAFPLAYLPTVWCWHWIVRRISGVVPCGTSPDAPTGTETTMSRRPMSSLPRFGRPSCSSARA